MAKNIELRISNNVDTTKVFSANLMGGGRGIDEETMALESHSNNVCPTIRTITNFVLICEPMNKETNKEPKICAMRGRSDGGCHGSASHLTKTMVSSNLGFRVRRLTERELFRLMDVSEEDIDKIQAAGISKTQQAKMAGNSIVVNVLYEIFRKIFVETHEEQEQMTLF